MEITLQIEKQNEWDLIKYIGPINEDAEVHLTPILEHLGSKCIFNFSKVKHVNSCGVRAWINFMRKAENGRNIVLEECTPEIVNQINMIPNFRGKAHIKSAYASVSCDQCGQQKWHLFEEGINMPKPGFTSLPKITCDKCSGTMEMDELEDEFFSWLKPR